MHASETQNQDEIYQRQHHEADELNLLTLVEQKSVTINENRIISQVRAIARRLSTTFLLWIDDSINYI